jgi:ABC-type nitrate/sulfonate/bicarbonate transport system substrate-binding protein
MPLSATDRSIAEIAKTTVWYTRCPVPSAWGVALRAGHFHQEFANDPHITFRSVLDSPDLDVHEAHYNGTLENAFRLGGNIPPIWARSRGANTRVVGISWTTTPSPILALPESSIRTAADLKGKRLLIIRRPDEEIDFAYAGTLRNYETTLSTVGLSLDDVELVEKVVAGSTERSKPPQEGKHSSGRRPIGASQRETLLPLLQSEVDVIASQGPAAIGLIDGFGLHVVHDISAHPDPLQRTHNLVPKLLTVDERLIEGNLDVVARVIVRLLEVPSWASVNREQAIHFVALEQGTSDDLVDAAYGEKFVPELELNLLEENIGRVAAQKAFLSRHRFIQTDFDLDQWIDRRPLQAAQTLVKERYRSGFAAPPVATSATVQVGSAGCVSRAVPANRSLASR